MTIDLESLNPLGATPPAVRLAPRGRAGTSSAKFAALPGSTIEPVTTYIKPEVGGTASVSAILRHVQRGCINPVPDHGERGQPHSRIETVKLGSDLGGNLRQVFVRGTFQLIARDAHEVFSDQCQRGDRHQCRKEKIWNPGSIGLPLDLRKALYLTILSLLLPRF